MLFNHNPGSVIQSCVKRRPHARSSNTEPRGQSLCSERHLPNSSCRRALTEEGTGHWDTTLIWVQRKIPHGCIVMTLSGYYATLCIGGAKHPCFSSFCFAADKRMITEPFTSLPSSKILAGLMTGLQNVSFYFMYLFLSERQLEFLERWFYIECIGNALNNLLEWWGAAQWWSIYQAQVWSLAHTQGAMWWAQKGVIQI